MIVNDSKIVTVRFSEGPDSFLNAPLAELVKAVD